MFRAFVVVLTAGLATAANQAPYNLRTNNLYHDDQLVVLDPGQDSLSVSFAAKSDNRGTATTQVKVVFSHRASAAVLNEISVETNDTTVAVPFAPEAGVGYVWRSSWTDSDGVESPLSAPAVFHAGPSQAMWEKSSWIGNQDRMLRKEFSFTPGSGSPMAYIAGIGYHQLYVNGQRVGDDALAGSWTTYNLRVIYNTYDLSSYLIPGTNVIGVMLGAGWRDTSAFAVKWQPGPCDDRERMLRLVVLDDSDATFVIGSDASWSATTKGPITMDSVYNGETYDARLEQPGWAATGFSPSNDWAPVAVANSSCFSPTLSPLTIPPISIVSSKAPSSINRIASGVQVIDFGDNLSGRTSIRVKGPAGTVVTLRHAEVLQHEPYGPKNGSVYTGNLRSAKATDTYILKGDPAGETYASHFTYHGFRYVQVEGYPGELTFENITQEHFRTKTRMVTSLASSSLMANKIQYGAQHGQASNQMSVPTDCDQRDERLGWMGDAGLSADSFALNFDYVAFQDNYLMLMHDNQDSTGSLPDTVPFMRYGNRPADPSWSAAFPQNLYVRAAMNSDLTPYKTYWKSLMAYFSELAGQVKKSGGLKTFHATYGDWVPADPNNKISNSVPAAANYILNVQQALEMGKSFAPSSDLTMLETLAKNLVSEFNSAFMMTLANGTVCWQTCGQAGYSLAYQVGAVSDVAALNKTLIADIVDRYDNHPSSGIIGIKAMFPTLTALNQHDVALNLLEQTTEPSYGYMFLNDLEPANSSIWELWRAPQTGPGMNSRNHHMFSSVSEWIVRQVGGLVSGSHDSSCFAQPMRPLVLAPAQMAGVSRSSLSLDAPCGTISLTYQRHGSEQCVRHPEGQSSVRTGAPVVEPAVLDCGVHGGSIKAVSFASYGTARGGCLAFASDASCHFDAMDVVREHCVGRTSCSIPTDADFWLRAGAPASCPSGAIRTLSAQVTCSASHAVTATVEVPVGTTATVHLPLSPTGSVVTSSSSSSSSSSAVVREGSAGEVFAAGRATDVVGKSGIVAASLAEDDRTVAVVVQSGTFEFMLA